MKNDTKLKLLMPLWVPSMLIGIIVSTVGWGFCYGLQFGKVIDKWLKNSEMLKQKERD